MDYDAIRYTMPNFKDAPLNHAINVRTAVCEQDGVAPEGFYLTTHFPTYYHVDNEWLLPRRSSLNCAAVLANEQIVVKELRDLKVGDVVILGSGDNGDEGIFRHENGFGPEVYKNYGSAVESALTPSYEYLYDLMRKIRARKGKIVWVLGPSVVFDYDTRLALMRLTEAGFVQAVLAGNAMATHDLEGGYLDTALGQNIYTQVTVPMGHYNHLDLLNAVRDCGSTKDFIAQGHVQDGFVKQIYAKGLPLVLAGSIRDDGPLPEVYGDVSMALTKMREQTDEASLIIGLATLLHNVATANLASSYQVTQDGSILPVFMYVVDVTENVGRKVMAARSNIATRAMVTNVQDFVVNLQRELAPNTICDDEKHRKAGEAPGWAHLDEMAKRDAAKAQN